MALKHIDVEYRVWSNMQATIVRVVILEFKGGLVSWMSRRILSDIALRWMQWLRHTNVVDESAKLKKPWELRDNKQQCMNSRDRICSEW